METQKAESFYLRHPQFSWALICITEKGDLFINSDWGTFGTAWRSFGTDFKAFLISINTDYLIGNFETNINSTLRPSRPYRIRKQQAEAISELFKMFQQNLKEATA